MNEHFKNIWFYSFGFDNATGGIIYAETREEALAKLKDAYQRDFAQVTVRPFGIHDFTHNPDVMEVYSL